jgi:hypothetical protein
VAGNVVMARSAIAFGVGGPPARLASAQSIVNYVLHASSRFETVVGAQFIAMGGNGRALTWGMSSSV